MKSESVKIIADLMISADVPDFAKEKLVQLMRIESLGTKVKGFKMTDYVSKDELKQTLTGVHYEEGLEVATDAHILVWLKKEVPSGLVGKTINTKGEEVYGKYPNWRAVVPQYSTTFPHQKIDFAKVEEFAKDWKAKKKITKKEMAIIEIFGCPYNLELVAKLAKAMAFVGCDELWYNQFYAQDVGHLCFGNLQSSGGLIMPMTRVEQNEQNEYYSL